MKWVDVLLRTSFQSLLSTSLAVLLGFFLAVLLLSEFSAKQRKISTFFLFWPSVMPAYFWFMVTAPLFGQSIWNLIFIQTLMNVGWVAWRLENFWSDQLSRGLELCYVEGASLKKIIFEVLLPMSRSQIFQTALTVFLFCFGNYSLAMLLAGPSWSLDVFLLQKWQEGQGLLPTINIAVVLWLVMLLCYVKVPPALTKPQVFIERFPMLKILGGKILLFLGLLTPLTFLYLFFHRIAWKYFIYLIPWAALFDSLLIGLVTGWLLWIFSALSLWGWASRRLYFFFSSLVSPPVSLLGLALVLLEVRGGCETLIISLGFALFLWPVLYRVFVAPYRDALIQQVQTASVCGSSRLHTLTKVILPQVNHSLFSMAALGAFWSVGDFSFASLLSYETTPLSKLIFEKINRYEMELAHAWFLWLLICAFISALFFIGCSYVANRKS